MSDRRGKPPAVRAALWLACLGLLPSPGPAGAQEAIEGLPAGGASRQIALPTGIQMHYVEAGDPEGEVVVFLHGYTDTHRSFRPTIEALLAGRPDLRALAPDLRGHGDTSLPPDEAWAAAPERCFAVADLAADVIEFLDALGLERVHLVGHSLGSMVAQDVALAAPERIASVVLIASAARAAENPAIEGFVLGELVEGTWRPALEARGLTWPADVYRLTPLDADPEAEAWLVANWVTEVAADPAYLAEMAGSTARIPLGAWIGVGRAVLGFDNVTRLAHLAVPALVLWAAGDAVLPETDQRVLRAALEPAAAACRARIVWKGYGRSTDPTVDLGHNFQWGAPAEVAADIAAWLDHRAPTPDLHRADLAAPHRIRTEPGAAGIVEGMPCP